MPLTPTLYLTRNGLLEPLGQSQVFAYIRGLSQEYSVTLITYEKPEDWADTNAMAQAHEDCAALGIRWLPQRFRPHPKFVAPVLSMLWMIWLVQREVRCQDIQLIHARSYVPAAVALVVRRMTKVPFIFDMRALWPEELITSGRLRRGSWMHSAIVGAERACLAESAGVISLTNAAAAHLKAVYSVELNDQRLVVIPTCADLDRFKSASETHPSPIVHGCIGSVLSGWFRTDWMASWISVAAARDPEAQFEIVTRDDTNLVRAAIDPEGELGGRLNIFQRRSEDMPAAVRGHSLSVMFYAGGEKSELGRSPTRMAEVLGSGLPVVANEGVGDVANIIREYNVGVIVEGVHKDKMESAFDLLQALLQDPDLSNRCRRAAEDIFSLQSGTDAYRALYSEILSAQNPQLGTVS